MEVKVKINQTEQNIGN